MSEPIFKRSLTSCAEQQPGVAQTPETSSQRYHFFNKVAFEKTDVIYDPEQPLMTQLVQRYGKNIKDVIKFVLVHNVIYIVQNCQVLQSSGQQRETSSDKFDVQVRLYPTKHDIKEGTQLHVPWMRLQWATKNCCSECCAKEPWRFPRAVGALSVNELETLFQQQWKKGAVRLAGIFDDNDCTQHKEMEPVHGSQCLPNCLGHHEHHLWWSKETYEADVKQRDAIEKRRAKQDSAKAGEASTVATAL